MHLSELAATSAALSKTRSRIAKRELLADLLRAAAPEEIELVATYLSGTLRQRRTGVGWRSLGDLPAPATSASLELVAVDAALEALSSLAGPGSSSSRKTRVSDLFAKLTDSEQEFLRALMTGGIRQGALDSVMLDAIAAAAGVPLAEVRRAAMFSAPTGPIARAALNGGAKSLAAFTLEVGRPIRPMLASSAADIATGVEAMVGTGDSGTVGSRQEIAVDTKLDGIRIQVHKHADQVLIFTRTLDEISDRLPAVVEVVRRLPETGLILDGEALVTDPDGKPRPFQETSSATASGSGDTARPFFFDVLAHNSESLMELPAADRWARLDALVPPDLRTRRLTTCDVADASRFFDGVIAAGHEGVILKDPGATYAAGRRGAAWIKVKPRHTLDLVVLAVEWGSGRRRGLLSNIHLGARNADGTHTMLGKTFKGMTDSMLAWQTDRFKELLVDDDGRVVTVRPEQVVEVAFDGVQRSRRYPGGVALRFARVLRYRDDKGPADADTLEAVRAIAGIVDATDV